MVETAKLFWELASSDRIKILKVLGGGKRRLSYIAQEINVSVQEAHRNLSRLMKIKLVDKDKDGYYILTPFGRYVLAVLPTLEFLYSNREYFLVHDISKIPGKFIYRLGELSGSKHAPDTFTAIRYIEMIIEESMEYTWILTEQVLVSALQLIAKKASGEVSFKIIIPYKIRLPPGAEIAENLAGKLNIRYIDSVDIALILNEKRGCLAFPFLDGRIDYRGFLVESREGHSWCKDVFQYYWSRSRYMRF